MIIVIAIIISIIITILMKKIIKQYFNNEKIKKKVLSGKNLLLNKDKHNLRLAIGAGIYIFVMTAFGGVKYYALLNILSATILIYSVSYINKEIDIIVVEHEMENKI